MRLFLRGTFQKEKKWKTEEGRKTRKVRLVLYLGDCKQQGIPKEEKHAKRSERY